VQQNKLLIIQAIEKLLAQDWQNALEKKKIIINHQDKDFV
jgi:hypothetical protein